MHKGWGVLLAVVALVVSSSCSGGSSGGSSDSTSERSDSESVVSPAEQQAETGWSFTDDRGVEVTLDAVPSSIGAHSVVAGGLWEYGIVASAVFGPLTRSDGTAAPAIGLAAPSDFVSAGELDGQIDLEVLAAAEPDVIVAAMWDDSFWGIADDEVELVESIAPIIGIRVDGRPIDEPLARFAELAEALGADDERIAEAQAAFDAASDRVRAATAANPELRVGAMSGTTTEMYVAYPPAFPDLSYFQELGLQLVEPAVQDAGDSSWETLSWERANEYEVDLILVDDRFGSIDTLMAMVPDIALRVPAVEAGQLHPWATAHAYGYGAIAALLETLAESVESAEPGIG